MRRFFTILASLRLTVIVFALSIFLIFSGTLAQVHQGIWTVVDAYFRSLVVTIEFQIFVPKSIATIPGGFWFPGGLTLGTVMFVNLMAAHIVRFKFTKKRMGIIITHFGVILLLAGEFVTGVAAKEGNMTILEGQSSNYTEDARATELAITDRSGEEDNLVVVVPDTVLASRPRELRHALLPFSISIQEWMPNSFILGPEQNQGKRRGVADSGSANIYAAQPIAVVSGVEGSTVDYPSMYVSFSKNNEIMGTYLLSAYLEKPQAVFVDGKTYWVELRFARSYKQYTLHLIDFKHDLFTGTQTARNYSSLVQLLDPERNVDREVLISMNNPLRYAGETFYQASFLQDDSGTVLQVVKNPGWLIPYASCTLITIGMLIQFGTRLVLTLRKSAA